MIKIQKNRLLKEEGKVIKTLSCPLRISNADLDRPQAPESQCLRCNRKVVNTDWLSELQLVALLEEDPSTCLKINRYNPIFQVVE